MIMCKRKVINNLNLESSKVGRGHSFLNIVHVFQRGRSDEGDLKVGQQYQQNKRIIKGTEMEE